MGIENCDYVIFLTAYVCFYNDETAGNNMEEDSEKLRVMGFSEGVCENV